MPEAIIHTGDYTLLSLSHAQDLQFAILRDAWGQARANRVIADLTRYHNRWEVMMVTLSNGFDTDMRALRGLARNASAIDTICILCASPDDERLFRALAKTWGADECTFTVRDLAPDDDARFLAGHTDQVCVARIWWD